MVSDHDHLRAQAARCRRLANALLDVEGAVRLQALAERYEEQAAQSAAQQAHSPGAAAA